MKCSTTNAIHICAIERGSTITGFPGVHSTIYSNSLQHIEKLKKQWIILLELNAYSILIGYCRDQKSERCYNANFLPEVIQVSLEDVTDYDFDVN